MSHIDDIATTLRQVGIDPETDAGSAVRRGWDYWQQDKALTDGRGAARTPHDWAAELPAGATWIVHPSMTSIHLVGGLWRQCLIRPGDPRLLSTTDTFAVTSLSAHCSRAKHMIALLGHTPLDLALYLDHLRLADPGLFNLILAKRFKEAVTYRPRIVRDPWPKAVIARWSDIQADYLPPFLVAVLYTELARLAMNQAGLLERSFDDGVELSTTQFLNRVPLAGGVYAPLAVTRAVEMLPFQSVALTGPDVVFERADGEVGAAWATSAAARIALAAADMGGLPIGPISPGAAKAIGANYAASPSFLPEPRRDHGSSRQQRPAATFWGLSQRRHAATGLLEIALAAQSWNERYRPDGKRLAKLPKRRRVQAMKTITFGWLAEVDPKAALAQLTKMAGSDTGLTAATVTPLSIDQFLGGRSGDTLFALAEDQLAKRPQPGELGYTARYMPHLSLNALGDDIADYRRFQVSALIEHERALRDELPPVLSDTGRVPDKVAAILGKQNGIDSHQERPARRQRRLAISLDPKLARAAQLEAQMITGLSTSPILEILLGRK